MPFTSDKIRILLNQKLLAEKGELEKMLDVLAEGDCLLKKGHKIGQPDHLFSRIDDETINLQIAKMEATIQVEPIIVQKVAPETVIKPEIKPEIAYEDFAKIDIRTTTIIAAEKIEKADKLLKLTLDLGFEQRTVVSGIAEHYQPVDVIGKKVSLLANLAPRKMKGFCGTRGTRTCASAIVSRSS